MAVIHNAYTFDPVKFHIMLEERVIYKRKLSVDALFSMAKEIVINADETTLDTLKYLRYSNEWLCASGLEFCLTGEWYMIAIASVLSPAPSLSSRLPASYYFLELALPVLGWTEGQVKKLLCGKPLRTLVETSGNSLFIAEFSALDQFGGWIDLYSVRTIFSRLQLLQDQFSFPSSNITDTITELSEMWNQDPRKMLVSAYSDAEDMLKTAIERNSALFLILD